MARILHSMYVVAWSDDVWKAGISYNMPNRFAQFGRDAILVDRFDFLDRNDATLLERATHQAMALLGEAAFSGPDSRGARRMARACGWTECYRMPVELGGDRDRSRPLARRAAHCSTWVEVIQRLPIEVDDLTSFVPHSPVRFADQDRLTPLLHLSLREVA